MDDLISRQALLDSFRKCYVGHMGMEQSDAMMMFRSICKIINEQPSAQPERKHIWNKTYDDGFPSEADQVLVTNGKNFWVDESVANDAGLEWACFDGCWENTEWAYFKDLYGLPSAQPEIIYCKDCDQYNPEAQFCDLLQFNFLPDGHCSWGRRKENR